MGFFWTKLCFVQVNFKYFDLYASDKVCMNNLWLLCFAHKYSHNVIWTWNNILGHFWLLLRSSQLNFEFLDENISCFYHYVTIRAMNTFIVHKGLLCIGQIKVATNVDSGNIFSVACLLLILKTNSSLVRICRHHGRSPAHRRLKDNLIFWFVLFSSVLSQITHYFQLFPNQSVCHQH